MRISNVIDNVSLNIKLMMLAFIALIAIAVPTSIYIQSTSNSIANTALEMEGSSASNSFSAALKVLQQHRGLAAGVLNGNTQQAADLRLKAQKLTRHF